MSTEHQLNEQDLAVLRELGQWKAETAGSKANQEKIAAWYAHDAGLASRRVMVMAEVTGLQGKRVAVPQGELKCVDPWARELEWNLRLKQFEIDVMKDDHIASPFIEYAPVVRMSDFGVPSGRHVEKGAAAYAFCFRPALETLDAGDFARLKHRTFTWMRDEEEQIRQRLEAIFDGILPVRRRSVAWQFYMPLTSTALDLVGLDQFMVLMYDNPDGLHRLMAFLRDDMMALNRFLEENGLYDLNNEEDHVGTGSTGFTRTLPAAGFSGKVRAKDRWFTVESQESVGISPAQYGEFVFPYLKELAGLFGRTYYGCCEPVDPVLEYVRTLPGLARVSVSPWANEEKMGQFCRESGVAYSRKPTPNIISAERFDESQQRDCLAKTVDAAHGCRLEIIQRDVYVTNDQPERFIRWVELAREVSKDFHR
jgi:hypothetical protein